jgi:hypothetical protein
VFVFDGSHIYFFVTQLNGTSSIEPLRFENIILLLFTSALAILLFKTTEPFTDTDSLLFFPSLLHSMDDETSPSVVHNEANALSFTGAGAHQGA